jgi:hypothetical protein
MEGRTLIRFYRPAVVAATTLLWLLIRWAAPWNIERYVGSVLVIVGVALYRSGPLPAREIIFHQAEGQRTCHSWALLENPQPQLCLRRNDHSRLDPRAAEAGIMGRSGGYSGYPRLSAPGVKRVYWSKPSEIPTGSTVASLGFEDLILSDAARTPVFALAGVKT